MNSAKLTDNSLHDDVFELLPWYVNGTLSDSQKVRVEDHVRNCITCRRELAIERRMLAAFREESPVDQSAQAGFERLRARLASATTPAQTSPARWRGGIRQWILKAGRYLPVPGFKWALIALPAAALAVTFGLVHLLAGIPGLTGDEGAATTARQGAGYKTLASSRGEVAGRNDIHVIFARDSGAESIGELLESLRARVVSGPNRAGVHTVRMPDMTSKDRRQAAIMQLRQHHAVLFAEAAQPMALPQPGLE